jgi:predicted peroxiredoxin
MGNTTILLFTRNGLGSAPPELQQTLAVKYLSLTLQSAELPAKILFYTEGVKLACKDSPVMDLLKELENRGVELILCSTCLDYFGLKDQVEVGIVGSMADILETFQKAEKVISL